MIPARSGIPCFTAQAVPPELLLSEHIFLASPTRGAALRHQAGELSSWNPEDQKEWPEDLERAASAIRDRSENSDRAALWSKDAIRQVHHYLSQHLSRVQMHRAVQFWIMNAQIQAGFLLPKEFDARIEAMPVDALQQEIEGLLDVGEQLISGLKSPLDPAQTLVDAHWIESMGQLFMIGYLRSNDFRSAKNVLVPDAALADYRRRYAAINQSQLAYLFLELKQRHRSNLGSGGTARHLARAA